MSGRSVSPAQQSAALGASRGAEGIAIAGGREVVRCRRTATRERPAARVGRGAEKALARAEGVHHAYVGKLLRLTLLAPDVVEAVLDGRLPKGLKLEDLVRPLPADWAGQRRALLDGDGG